MAYSQITPVIGQVQQGFITPAIVDTVQKCQLGMVVPAVDNFFGFGEFMYVQVPTSTALTQGQVVVINGFGGASGYSVAVAPTTANTGRSIAIACNAVASNATQIQYTWVQISGNAVIRAAASVAAGTTFGIDTTTAGSVAANSAGRQVLNAVSIAPSTTNYAKVAQLTNGSPIIRVQNVDGWVPGLALSGTGVSGTILSINEDSRTVTMSANASAGGASTVTATYTGFIVGQINRPCLQGAIT